MRTLVLCAVVAAACIPRIAIAQTAPLTEADALNRLSADSPRVRAITAAIEVVRADVLAASRFPNPRVLWDRESVLGSTEHIVTVAQSIPVSGRRRFERLAAELLVSAESGRADDAMRRARADLRLAYGDLAAAQARERALVTSVGRLRGLVAILVRREAAGDTAGFDRLRAERELAEVETRQADAVGLRLRAQATLSGFFAAPTDVAALQVVEPANVVTTMPAVDALIDRALTTRGDLIALTKEHEAARFAQDAAGRRWIPEPEVIAGTKSSSVAGGDIGSVISVQATVPLFDRAQPERAVAAARARQAAARAESLRQSIRAAIIGLYADLVSRQAAVARYRESALPSSESIARIAQVSYDAGERTILELLDALQTSSAATLREIELSQAARDTQIELEFISGWELP
jgi:cobalt-zinc-cadmium efflux system outer membrane protein